MRSGKRIIAVLGVLLSVPLLYFLVSLILSYITVNKRTNDIEGNSSIYLTSNGNHLELIIPKTSLDGSLLEGIHHTNQENYISFGWGERTYYIKTAQDLHITVADKFRAAFMNSPALLHVRRYIAKKKDWGIIQLKPTQLNQLQTYIKNTFKLNEEYKKIVLPGIHYGKRDNFYEAKGSYTCFNTCNTWVNTGLKKSYAKACIWTPFDFGVLRIYSH